MPHVSTRKLDKTEQDKLYKELTRSFERGFINKRSRQVFNQFFTKTEKEMFAKRLAVIAMLSRGVSTYMISETLGMSPRTVEYMSLRYEEGEYDEIVKYALGNKDIWKILEEIVTLGGMLPQKVGGKRWQMLDKLVHEETLKRC